MNQAAPQVSPTDVKVGDVLPELRRTPTRVTLFMFGVAYWTSHRAHYDVEFARAQGFKDVLVTANLLSAYNAELVTSWAGAVGTLRSLEERSLSPAVAGDTVIARGTVVKVEDIEDGQLAWCDLQIFTEVGVQVVQGTASVFFAGPTG
jgi:acyl dehydratase